MKSSIVIRPDFLFEQTSQELEALGWVREPDRLVAASILPGEPEVAAWRRQDRATSLSYSFNPVVFLRKLTFDGGTADEDLYSEVAGRLPSLDLAALCLLLQFGDESQLLLGIFAARELGAFDTIDLLDALRGHQHERIATAAREAHGEMLRLWLESGGERLREEKRRHPGRSVLFPLLGNAHIRRQTLRWLIHDYREANEHIIAVLRSGLVDEDWEVRATAMLAAAQLGARELGGAIRHVELPRTTHEGLHGTDLSILVAVRTAVLEQLEGKPRAEPERSLGPDWGGGRVVERDRLMQHLRRCVAGFPTDRYDRIFLFVHALTQPLDLEGPAPELPPGIIEEQGQYRLTRSGILLCWIAPIPHWLGADDEDLPQPNPIRQVIPPAGFFIAQHPLTVATAQWIDSGRRPDDSGAISSLETIYHGRWQEALCVCERLGQLESLSVTLPTADQWEMAARGTDGRRFPWGNGFEGDPHRFASPWGVEKQSGGKPEWTNTTTHSGEHIICGGADDLRCAARAHTLAENPSARFAVRPVVVLGHR